MTASYRRLKLLLLFIVTVVIATLGLGALIPTVQHRFGSSLGIKPDSDEAVADACVPEQTTSSDDAYFLSCGDIY